MLKHSGASHHLLGIFALRQDRMAGVAIFRYDLAFRTHMLSVMTAEAAARIQMSNIVRMRLPVELHLRKSCALVNALRFLDGIANVELTRFGEIWIGFLVITLDRV